MPFLQQEIIGQYCLPYALKEFYMQAKLKTQPDRSIKRPLRPKSVFPLPLSPASSKSDRPSLKAEGVDVRTKFCLAVLFSLAWTVLSVFAARQWRNDIAALAGSTESSRYFAIAFSAQLRDDSLSMTTPLTRPSTVVQLANVWFPTSQLANQAVLSESQRRIDAYNDEHS